MIKELKRFDWDMRPIKGSFMDIFPDVSDIIEVKSGYLDCKRSLVLRHNHIPSEHSFSEYLFRYDGDKFGWINNVAHLHKHLSQKESFKHEIELRKQKTFEYIKTLNFSSVKKISDDYIYVNLLDMLSEYTFGHFLDFFIKLKRLEKYKLHKKVCYILSGNSRIVNLDKWLNILSPISNYEILWLRDYKNTILQFDVLIDIKRPASIGYFSEINEFFYIKKQFNKKFKHIPANKNTKVFLARVPPQNRYIKNYEALLKTLKSKNIHILYGNEPLEEVYRIIKSSSHICGYHGSLFINALLFNENSCILEYCPKTRINLAMPHRSLGTKYHFVKFIDTDKKWNAELDIDEILSFYESDKDYLYDNLILSD